MQEPAVDGTERAGGGGRSNEAVAMLPRGGRATDDTTRGVEAEGAARGELEADDSTRVGGRTTRGRWGGAHDVVGGGGDNGNCGGDSGGGGWSSEVGAATAPASGGG